MSSKRRGYSDAERAAYYKSKYASAAKAGSPKAPKYKAKAKAAKAAGRSARYRSPGLLASGGGSLGALAGGALGGPAGAAIGKMLGGKLGHIVEHITGFGDYQVSHNSIMDGMMQPAQVVNSVDRGCVIVRHREYIGDINSTSAFTLAAYPINPGRSETFPWLSGIAQNFEQYRMRGCLFEFLSTSSDAILASASSAALGTVNMATEYDSLETNFSSKREMLNHEFANSRKPSQSFIHPIECKKSRTAINEQYVRTNAALPAGADLRLYDLGKFQIATEGMQAATGVCGELWVTYEVELFKAKYETTYVNDGLSDHFKLITPSQISPLGSSATLTAGSTLGGTVTGTNVYTFPNTVSPGDRFLFTWNITASNSVAITFPVVSTTGCVGVPFFGSSSSYAQILTPIAGTTSAAAAMTYMLSIVSPGATVTLGTAGVLPSTGANGDLIVTQVASGLSLNKEVEVVELSDDDETPEYTAEYVKQLEEQVTRLRKLERKPTV